MLYGVPNRVMVSANTSLVGCKETSSCHLHSLSLSLTHTFDNGILSNVEEK